MKFNFMNDDIVQSTEEKKLVMNKTISASTDPSEETIKVDYLDKDNELEKDILKQRKAERDITSSVPLPLFRFEEKQKKEIINFISFYLKAAITEKKDDPDGFYIPLNGYLEIPKLSNVEHLVNLTISRNRELYNSSPKNFKIELITCFYEKKLRMKYDIQEDELLNPSEKPEYYTNAKDVKESFKKFFDEINESFSLGKTGIEKDIELVFEQSEGDENFGSGYSIFLIYKKMIDYSNYRRGKEAYNGIFDLLDGDFARSIEEQNNVKVIQGTEAIADGMGDDSDDSDESDDETQTDGEEDDGSLDDDGLSMDDTMDDGEGDDEGGEEDDGTGDDFGDDSGDSSDMSSDSSSDSKSKLNPGVNPFADINSKERITTELNELKEQIDKVLIKLEGFKSNVVVNKLIELSSIVKDALKTAYIVPYEDTLIRYSLYVTQFEDLISKLKRSFEQTHKDTQKNS